MSVKIIGTLKGEIVGEIKRYSLVRLEKLFYMTIP